MSASPDGRLAARHVRGTLTSGLVIDTLGCFRRRFGARLLIVWDRRQAPRARTRQRVRAAHPDQFAAAFLPASAPDLTPEEQGNPWVKRDRENALPATVAELASFARRSFRRPQRRPTLMINFLRHAGLDVYGLS